MCVCVCVVGVALDHCSLSGISRGGIGVFEHPPSASTSLIIHYSHDLLHDTAQLAPAPSEKTITGATSSRYALHGGRSNE